MKKGKRQYSIQSRVFFYFFATFFLVISLIVGFLFVFMNNNIRKQIDDKLIYQTQLISHIWIEEKQKNPENVGNRVTLEIKSSYLHTAVFDKTGKLIFHHNLDQIPANLSTRDRKTLNQMPLLRHKPFNGNVYRTYTTAFYDGAELIGYIYMKDKMAAIGRVNKAFVLSVPIATALLLIPVFIFGRFLSKDIINSISTVSNAIDQIGGNDIKARIATNLLEPEFIPLAMHFNNMCDRLEKSFNDLRNFTSDASHQLRTPLAIIKSNLEVTLRQERSISKYVETISINLDEINRLNKIVNWLLALSQSNTGNTPFQKSTINITEIINDVAGFIIPLAEVNKIQLNLSLMETALMDGDEEWIRQLIFNLLDNSIKFCSAEDSINVILKEKNDSLILQICDTGPGIPEEQLPRVMDRFFKGPNHKNGSGIGLAICKWVVEEHGGSIRIESKSGSGTSVIITFIN